MSDPTSDPTSGPTSDPTSGPTSGSPHPVPERTLYRGGFVYSPVDPFATALLTVDGQIAWIGSDEAAGTHLDGAGEVVELDGALVTPAFVDAHVHLSMTGQALTGVDLSGASSLVDALGLVEAAARQRGGRPLFAHSFDEDAWPERRAPTRSELDRAAYGGVVYAPRVDVHSAVVSSALAAASGARSRAGWQESGLVRGDAHHAVRGAFAAGLSHADRATHRAAALQSAAAAGIGLVHEHGSPQISSEEDLVASVAAGAVGDAPQVFGYWGELVADADAARLLVSRLPIRGLAGDLCVDGSIGSRTACLREPYADVSAGNHRGTAYLSSAEVRDHVVACTQAGTQAGFHVIGDAAADIVVTGLRDATGVLGAPALRAAGHRLEHLEMVDADAIEALAALGVTASVQPAFDAAWGGPMGMYAARLGLGRAVRMNPFATMASMGLPFALGSDSPVTPFDPWAAVSACVNHRTAAQRLSARSAFLAHTRAGWRAAGIDDRGYLAPGQPATLAVWAVGDLVVQAPDRRVQNWSTDPRSGTPGLPDVSPGASRPRSRRTVIRGRTVFEEAGALT